MIKYMQNFIHNMQEILSSLNEFLLLKAIGAALFGFASYMVGIDQVPLVGTLTVLVIIDFITGVYAAFYNKEIIESRKMIKTAIKWTLYLLMISAGHLTEELIPGDWFLAEVTIAFLGATELVSILENIGKVGVGIPRALLTKLEKFRDGA